MVAWISWARATGIARARDLDRLARERCASEKMPSSIFSCASPARTVARSADRLARDELDRAVAAAACARGIAGGAADVGQALVEQAHPDPVAPRVEAARWRTRGRRSPARSGPTAKRRLGGPHLELDAVRAGRGARRSVRRRDPAPGDRGR